jgi:hypothetical protein
MNFSKIREQNNEKVQMTQRAAAREWRVGQWVKDRNPVQYGRRTENRR